MKNKIIKILCSIVCFVVTILLMIRVNAVSLNDMGYETNYVSQNNNMTNNLNNDVYNDIASDTSGEASSINRIAQPVIIILKWTALISGIIFFINGIRILIKKKQKRGVIYIIIALFLIWSFIMLDALVIHDHNIKV